jgi:hypothetical protein
MSAYQRRRAVGFCGECPPLLAARYAGEDSYRPYFLARQAPTDQQGRMTATGAFATIILERLLDVVTVLLMLASLVFVFGKDLAGVNPTGFALVKWAGASAAIVSTSALAVLFLLAGDPERLGRTMARLSRCCHPARGTDRRGRREIRPRPGCDSAARPLAGGARLVASAVAVHRARHLVDGDGVPLRDPLHRLLSHDRAADPGRRGADAGAPSAASTRRFASSATMFYGAPDAAAVGAAIVLHLFTIGPALLLGLFFAAREGLNMGSMQRLANQTEPGHVA